MYEITVIDATGKEYPVVFYLHELVSEILQTARQAGAQIPDNLQYVTLVGRTRAQTGINQSFHPSWNTLDVRSK